MNHHNQRFTSFRKALLAICIGSTLLAGCGGDSEPEKPKQQAAASEDSQLTPLERAIRNQEAEAEQQRKKKEAETSAAREAATKVTKLETPAWPAPEGAVFLDLKDADTIAFIYQALTEAPDSAQYIADSYRAGYKRSSPELQKALDEYLQSDGFKKRDALKVLEPVIAKEIEDRKDTSRYFKMTMNQAELFSYKRDYNFEKLGFDTDNSMLRGGENARFSMGDLDNHAFRLMNGKEIEFLKITDEAAARLIEEIQSNADGSGDEVQLNIYGYIESVTRHDTAPNQRDERLIDLRMKRIELVRKLKPSEVLHTAEF